MPDPSPAQASLAFLSASGPPAHGGVLVTVGWALLHQLTIRKDTPSGLSDRGNLSTETPAQMTLDLVNNCESSLQQVPSG